MSPNQLNRDSTYPMKSITPIRKSKVLQTFGKGKIYLSIRKAKKTNEIKEYRLKDHYFCSFKIQNS